MPPKIKINQEMILKNALAIVHEKGIRALNARSLAERMNCSVQPIFRVYGSMEELKSNVCQEIRNIYNENMIEYLKSANKNSFLNMGMFYIRFAKEHANYFTVLFMTDNFNHLNVSEIAGSTVGDTQIIELIMHMANLDYDKAQQLFTAVWLMTHGIAALFATNNCKMTEDEIETLLSNTFNGLLHVLKNSTKESNYES